MFARRFLGRVNGILVCSLAQRAGLTSWL